MFVLDNSYHRGSDASGSGKDGSGLGLYLASLFMEKMGGGGHLNNAAAQVDLSVEGAIKRIMEITEEMIV